MRLARACMYMVPDQSRRTRMRLSQMKEILRSYTPARTSAQSRPLTHNNREHWRMHRIARKARRTPVLERAHRRTRINNLAAPKALGTIPTTINNNKTNNMIRYPNSLWSHRDLRSFFYTDKWENDNGIVSLWENATFTSSCTLSHQDGCPPIQIRRPFKKVR